MNFDVIKEMFPNHKHKIDEIIKKQGSDRAQKKLFGCFIKVINIMFSSDDDLLIIKKKNKERRIAGLNNVKNKCDKIIKKQERKKKHLENKIQEINEEKDEVPEQIIMNPVVVVEEQHKNRVLLLEKALEEKEHEMRELIRQNTSLMVQKTIMENKSSFMRMDALPTTDKFESGIQCDLAFTSVVESRKAEMFDIETQSEFTEIKHEHSLKCLECSVMFDRERLLKFGDVRMAADIMRKLNNHNFLQPNKHETILLVKEAMASIKGSIKHKFSLFLSEKMMDMCELLLLTFSQFQQENDRQYKMVMNQINKLK